MFTKLIVSRPGSPARSLASVRAAVLASLLLGSAPLTARAQGASAVAIAPASPGQPALAAGFVGGDQLRARVCPTTACSLDQGTDLRVPADADVKHATLAVVRLGHGRHAVHVRAPIGSGEAAWEAVLVAPLQGTAPLVVFAGKTGFAEGEYGLRHGGMVVITPPDANRTRSILVGQQLEEVTICGRPTILEQRLLDPTDLQLKRATYQRLTSAERASAPRLVATPLGEGATGAPSGLLYNATASGSLKAYPPAALVDGDLDTAWSEGRGGPGRGEFVALHASVDQPISGFELVLRPTQSEIPDGEAPREVWLATTSKLFHVELPEDAWDHPGQRLEVTLPEPVATECVALVIEGFPPHPRGSQATVAELFARSAFAQSSIEDLVAKLPGGGPDAEQAGAVLRSRGEPAFRAVAAAFAGLDEGGRRIALDVIDQAPCAIRAPVYAQALRGTVEAQQLHAEARLRDCGDEAALALLAELDTAPSSAVGRLADQLTLVAPDRAVERLVPRLSGGSTEERRTIRVVLGRAAQSPRVSAAIGELLRDSNLDDVAAVDLLRSLGPTLDRFSVDATGTLLRLIGPEATFRTKYLLLEPAAHLAPHSSGAMAFLRHSIAEDPDWRIRSQATVVLQNTTSFQDVLLGALGDENVRVRISAIRTIARAHDVPASSHLAELLRRDRWPIARAEAALALGGMGPGSDVDRALLAAIRDRSRHVRAPALLALGERHVSEASKPARKRLADDDEDTNVRIAAAVAIGKLCDSSSLDMLTRIARRMADPNDLSEERDVAPAAVAALGRIHPGDLQSRLAPLLKKGAPPVARAAARAALAADGTCSH